MDRTVELAIDVVIAIGNRYHGDRPAGSAFDEGFGSGDGARPRNAYNPSHFECSPHTNSMGDVSG